MVGSRERASEMQLKYMSTLAEGKDGFRKVTAFAWSPNNAKLAVVTTDRVGEGVAPVACGDSKVPKTADCPKGLM